MTSCEVRKLSFLPFCQRSERRIKERKMDIIVMIKKKTDGCKLAHFMEKKSLYKINE